MITVFLNLDYVKSYPYVRLVNSNKTLLFIYIQGDRYLAPCLYVVKICLNVRLEKHRDIQSVSY